jgi:hypothetical protein
MRCNAVAWGTLGLLVASGGCGEGLRDGLGEVAVTRVVDPPGPAEVVLAQARFLIKRSSLSKPATVKLRRLPKAEPSGPIGPVFELTVEGTGFSQPPVMEIAVSPAPWVPEETLIVSFHGGGATDYSWQPLTSSRSYDPQTRTVRGDVTVPLADRTLRFGMLAWCGTQPPRVDKCPVEGQTCHYGACQ